MSTGLRCPVLVMALVMYAAAGSVLSWASSVHPSWQQAAGSASSIGVPTGVPVAVDAKLSQFHEVVRERGVCVQRDSLSTSCCTVRSGQVASMNLAAVSRSNSWSLVRSRSISLASGRRAATRSGGWPDRGGCRSTAALTKR